MNNEPSFSVGGRENDEVKLAILFAIRVFCVCERFWFIYEVVEIGLGP